ncbi:hypothetical protein BSKO_08195 [Bryopsis sp. KO-2023]|nr:hypothetical protein BSKO_08195 [Bryopsis sp. KO-2023]
MGYLAPTRRSEEDMSELLTLRPGQIRSRLLGASRRADLAQYRRALAGVRLPTDFGGLVIDICAERKQHTMYDYALLVRSYGAFVFHSCLHRDEFVAWDQLCTAATHYTSHRGMAGATMDDCIERGRVIRDTMFQYARNVQTLFGAGMCTFNLHKIICVGYRQESVRGAISRSGESWVERAVGHIKRVSAGRVKRYAGETIANDVLSDMALRANANMLSQDEQSVVDAIITPPPRKPLETITTLEYTFSFLPRPVSASDIRTFVDAIREAIRTWGFSLPGWTVRDLLPYAIERTFRVTRDTIHGREEFFATGWSSTERGDDSTCLYVEYEDDEGRKTMYGGHVRAFYVLRDAGFGRCPPRVVAMVDLYQLVYVDARFRQGRPVRLTNLFKTRGRKLEGYPVLLEDALSKLMCLREGQSRYYCFYTGGVSTAASAVAEESGVKLEAMREISELVKKEIAAKCAYFQGIQKEGDLQVASPSGNQIGFNSSAMTSDVCRKYEEELLCLAQCQGSQEIRNFPSPTAKCLLEVVDAAKCGPSKQDPTDSRRYKHGTGTAT